MKRFPSAAEWGDDASPVANVIRPGMVDRMGTEISCFENEVPRFVEAELERLYSNLHSSIKKFETLNVLDGASTYILRKNGEISSLFLFRIDGDRVRVLNEVIRISQAEVQQFCDFIFSKFTSVAAIFFKAINTDVQKLSYPFQRLNYLEDLVIDLPNSEKEYMGSLGNATRRNIKYYTNKLKREFPSFKFIVLQGEQISEEHVKAVLHLRSVRYADKYNTKADMGDISPAELGRVFSMVKGCGGIVSLATIDGNICAGQISYRVGKNEFGAIIAHDPEYNGYWLGVITCYLTISDCISHGGKEFHFQWGRHEYKYRLLGVQRDLDNVHIYRSVKAMVLNGDIVIASKCRAFMRGIKLWLLDPKNRQTIFSRTAFSLMQFSKSMQHRAANWKRRIHK